MVLYLKLLTRFEPSPVYVEDRAHEICLEYTIAFVISTVLVKAYHILLLNKITMKIINSISQQLGS
jgi:hypothetical protein